MLVHPACIGSAKLCLLFASCGRQFEAEGSKSASLGGHLSFEVSVAAKPHCGLMPALDDHPRLNDRGETVPQAFFAHM